MVLDEDLAAGLARDCVVVVAAGFEPVVTEWRLIKLTRGSLSPAFFESRGRHYGATAHPAIPKLTALLHRPQSGAEHDATTR